MHFCFNTHNVLFNNVSLCIIICQFYMLYCINVCIKNLYCEMLKNTYIFINCYTWNNTKLKIQKFKTLITVKYLKSSGANVFWKIFLAFIVSMILKFKL